MVPVLPESAPFTPAQRAWLNGFFAAVLGGEAAAARTAELTRPSATDVQLATPSQEEAFPWHDSSLSMEERLKLSEGKPLPRVLMSAMAQLDCGACGYLCKTYGEAIANGTESCLTLCAPGGAATAKKLKEVLRDAKPHGTAVTQAPEAQPLRRAAAKPGTDRKSPFAARLLKSTRLNSERSGKETRHVVLDLEGSSLEYEPGDSLGIWPENCPDLVEAILRKMNASGDEAVPVPSGGERPLREALLKHYTVSEASEELQEALRSPLPGSDSNTGGPDVLEALESAAETRLSAVEIVLKLTPLAPRLYSISSSPRAHPDEVHLTVGVVRYSLRGRERKGVASTFLAERARSAQRVQVFVQKSHDFRLPRDAATPIVMIGPGTGVAPFRAFLEERRAAGARGRSWLFFGDQRREHDFLYRDELEEFRQNGVLTRLDLAFSRDQAEKIYVQHRMRENAGELWRWIEDGAAIYVCGDAKKMAKDVDSTLCEIARTHGGHDAAGARAFVDGLARSHRYLRDVY